LTLSLTEAKDALTEMNRQYDSLMTDKEQKKSHFDQIVESLQKEMGGMKESFQTKMGDMKESFQTEKQELVNKIQAYEATIKTEQSQLETAATELEKKKSRICHIVDEIDRTI